MSQHGTHEYKTAQIVAELPELETKLNEFGEEGWCLAHIERIGGQDYQHNSNTLTPPIYQAIFMRSAFPEAPPQMDIGSMLGGLFAGGFDGLLEGDDMGDMEVLGKEEEQTASDDADLESGEGDDPDPIAFDPNASLNDK
jgi:hypothetical protein